MRKLSSVVAVVAATAMLAAGVVPTAALADEADGVVDQSQVDEGDSAGDVTTEDADGGSAEGNVEENTTEDPTEDTTEGDTTDDTVATKEPEGEYQLNDPAYADEGSGATADGGVQTYSESATASTSSVTGVTLGSGSTVYAKDTVNQQDVRSKALNNLIKWRKDALNDSRIKMSYGGTYYKMSDYLKKIGMSQSEYLSPQWSNAMERVAIQRVIEAYDIYYTAHYRLNGERFSTASYKGIYPSTEILAWGSSSWYPDINAMMDNLWANEKDDYIKEINGQAHDQTGHYRILINPSYKSYGFAMASSQFGKAAAGEASSSKLSDTSATNLKGTYSFDMNVSDSILSQGVTWSGVPSVMGVSESAQPTGKLAYLSPRITCKGTWSTSNSSVVAASGNKLTAKAKGSAKVTVKQGNQSKSWTITVKNKLQRLAGSARYDTMAKLVSTGGWSTGGTVIVASGENYPDALAASSLAGALSAPIVLVKPGSVPSQSAARLKALKPSKIVVVGGASAVSDSVINTLRGYAWVTRIDGAERVETALKIYQDGASKLGAKWGTTAILATADNFADALSVSSYAYKDKAPIFLVKGSLSDEQTAALKSGKFKRVLVIGGTVAVSDGVVSQAKAATGVEPVRLSGATRYSTSVAIAKWAVANEGMSVNNSVYATGTNFPDALAAGPVAGKKNGVLLLVKSSDPTAVTSFVSPYSGKVTSAWVAGGTAAVSANAANKIADNLGMKRP